MYKTNLNVCDGLNYIPPNFMSKALPPVLQAVTIFGDRAFEEVTEVTWVGPNLV